MTPAAPGAVPGSRRAPVRPGARARTEHPERELAEAIRAELAAIEPARSCCRAAERAGLGAAAEGRARTPAVARLAVRLAGGGDRPVARPVPGLPPRPDETPARGISRAAEPFNWDAAALHCRVAYLRGLFLAHGSLSLGAGRTHLEIVVPIDHGPELARRLAEAGFSGAARTRRGRGVITWKSRESVAAFLRAVGAGPALLELEARGVTRTLHGQLNRLFNADAANVVRSVNAARRQVTAIERLRRSGRLDLERRPVRATAAARLASPDATLDDLARDLGRSRSQVQRALVRLERLAAELEAGGHAVDDDADREVAAPGPPTRARRRPSRPE